MGAGVELRLDRVCRVCLQEKKDMRPLFQQLVADMLMACAAVQISDSDGLPSQLCLQCVHQVSRCYSFKQKVEQSDAQLRTYIEQNPDKTKVKESEVEKPPENHEIKFQYTIDSSQSQGQNDGGSSSTVVETFFITSEPTSDSNQTTSSTITATAAPQEVQNPTQDSPVEIDKSDSNNTESKEDGTNDDLAVENYLELATFQATVSVNPGRHICNLCHREFKHARWLKMHMRMHSNWIKENCKKPPMCNICQRTFKGPGMLKLHMKTHEERPQRPPTCTICQSVFKTKTILYRHRQTHFEEKTHRCTICDRSFISNYALKAHYARHRGEKPHTCSTCGKSFYNTTDLKVHIRLHTGEKPLTCGECGKTFRRHSTLCQHIKKHKGIRDHVCPVCNKAFFEVSKLTAHMRVHTGEKPFECSYCMRRFAQQSALIYHQRTHTGEKPYPCKLCDARFTTSSARKNHLSVHTGIKKYPCTVCNKGCTNRSELRIHMTKHTGEKLFPCTECNQRFSTASYLAVHRRNHGGENKKLVCSVCSKVYTDSAAYKRHIRTHTPAEIEPGEINMRNINIKLEKGPVSGAKNYACTLCSKSYTQGQNLKKHMMTHGVLNPIPVEGVSSPNIQQQQQQIRQSQSQTQQVQTQQVQAQQQQAQPQQQQQQIAQQQQHHHQHQIVQQPQQLQVQTIQIHPQHVSAHHGQPIQIHAVGVHQVQQQQVHVASSACQSVQIPNIVQVPPDASCLGQQITMSQIHDQTERLQFQNYPLQAVTNMLSVPQGQPAYYIVVNNSNIKKDPLGTEGEM